MAPASPQAFERAFPLQEFSRGTPRAATLWSILGTLFLVFFLITAYLIVDLLASGGTLVVMDDYPTEIPAATAVPAIAPEEPAAEKPAGEAAADAPTDAPPPPPAEPPAPRTVADEVEKIAGQTPDSRAPLLPASPLQQYRYDGRGILHAVWGNRARPFGLFLATLYRRIPWLRSNAEALVLLIGGAALFWALRWYAHTRSRTLRLQAALEVSGRLRSALHRQALRLEPGDLDGRDRQALLDLFTLESDALRDAVFHWIDVLSRAPVKLALLLVLALLIHPLLTIQCAIPLGACWLLVQRERERIAQILRLAADRSSTDLRFLAESLGKTRLVRGYGMEEFAREQFEKHLDRYQRNAAVLVRSEGLSGWGYRVLVVTIITLVAILICDKVLRFHDELTLAGGLLFVAIFVFLSPALNTLWRLPDIRRRGELAAQRLFRYLDRTPEVSQAVGAKFLAPLTKSLEFLGVAYGPADRRLVNDVSVKIPAGKLAAVIATDPREARAFCALIPRFIDPQAGQIRIDGEDIAWVTLESLREETLYVGGDAIFTGTILDNLRGGVNTYTLTDATEAAKTVHAHQFISKLPQGYETVIGEHGERLDPGQVFRLSLARALLRKPALMIVEEPAAPLDDNTKSLLEDAYARIQPGRTLLFLPGRLSTLRRADQIIFLHQGKILAVGTHADLMQSCPLYRHWEYVNFNEFRHQMDGTPLESRT